jgi:hypothetical protein
MGDDKKIARGSRVLRFAVSSALLVSPMAVGCGSDEVSVNEPVETINEPMPDPVVNEPIDPPPTVNEPPQQPPEPTNNEPAPEEE